MTGGGDDFDDFLARRRKLFRRPEEDVLEPPDDVDRIVLRQAREAIETRGAQREIRGVSWGAPLALAASLLVAFTIVLNIGMSKKEPVPQVTVEQVAQRRDYPAPAPAAAENRSAPSGAAAAPGSMADSATVTASAPTPSGAERAVAKTASTPAWRRDSDAWLAEIQRLRAAGRDAEADVELAEYKRQYRSFAGAPDR